MNSLLRRTVTVLLLSSAGWTGTTLAQDGTKRNPPAAEAPPAAAAPAPNISVDFPGGTVGEYIIALQRAGGETPVNVIITEEARLAKMGPVSLKLVPIGLAVTSLKAAAEITDNSARWDVEVVREPREDREYGAPERTRRGRVEVFRVQYQKRVPERLNDEQVQQAFATRSLTETRPAESPGSELTPEALQSAVRAAVSLHDAETGRTTKLVFHPESGAILLSGSDAIGRQVRDLLREFQQQRETRRRSEYEGQIQEFRETMNQRIKELNAEISELQTTNRTLQAERARMQAEIKELTAKQKAASSDK